MNVVLLDNPRMFCVMLSVWGVFVPLAGSTPPCLPAPHTTLRVHCASYLVDPASSHMLVSKIKPCMSKYKPH